MFHTEPVKSQPLSGASLFNKSGLNLKASLDKIFFNINCNASLCFPAGTILNGFVSPELSHWTISGEGLIMIIVGGIGSLSGAILGAAVVHILQHELSKLVDWWMLLMGGGFILIVLFMKDGLWGIILKFKNYIMEKI